MYAQTLYALSDLLIMFVIVFHSKQDPKILKQTTTLKHFPLIKMNTNTEVSQGSN